MGLRHRTRGRRARAALAPGAGVIACALGLAASAGAAPTAIDEPLSVSVDGSLTATSNGGLDEKGAERADLIASVRPELTARHEAPGLGYKLHAAVTLLDYARDTQPGGALPDVRGELRSTLLDRWLYLDAAGYLRYAEADPFGARADNTTGTNRRTQSGFSIAPRLQRDLTPQTQLFARDEFASTNDDAGDRSRVQSNHAEISVERKPTPLGVAASYTRLDNRTLDSSTGDSTYLLESVRLRGKLRVVDDLEFGLNIGEDRSDYLLSQHDDFLYGGSVKWAPSPRTNISLEIEHRFFGQSGSFLLEHRTPFLAFSVQFSRQPLDAATSLGSLGQGTDLHDFLNAILTTRYPDPSARAGAVDNIIATRGLDPRAAGAINVIGDYPQLQTSTLASLTYLGRVDTATLSVYASTTRVLSRGDDPFVALAAATADNRQSGGSFQFSHRLDPELTAELLARWSRYAGLDARAGERSDEQNYRISLIDQLSARSRLSLGLQWDRFISSAAGQRSYDAALVLVGLVHRF